MTPNFLAEGAEAGAGEGREKEGVGGDLEVAVGVTVDEQGYQGGHGAQGDALGLAAAAFEAGETGSEEPVDKDQHHGDGQDAGFGGDLEEIAVGISRQHGQSRHLVGRERHGKG
ncbi:MAG: hypothetical protein K9L23_17295, partial [Desulfotignum sp.]|nr:hypothetical protein [Desulfotignum sp.]